jgi:RND family efflux transporter MFP subunit
MTDTQLLERFTTRRDETAFEELLARHGPMILSVCQQLLRGGHDAEDAFQATFLVLVRKVGSIGQPHLLANWLYGVAHRVASRMSVQTARRRLRERRGVELVAVEPFCQVAWDDIRPVIHAEVSRLPEKYRTAIVLCYLQGKSQDEAAAYLECSAGAIKGRLERGRNLLRKRLCRRGLALSIGALATVVSAPAIALSPPLVASTVKAATLVLAGQAAGAVSAQVIGLMEGVLNTMFLTKLKIAAVLVLIVSVLGGSVAVPIRHLNAAEHAEVTQTNNREDAEVVDSKPVLQTNRDQKAPENKITAAPAPRKVQVTQPTSRKVTEYGNFIGRSEAATAEIRSTVSGPLVKVNFTAGAAVKKGDSLFEIDPRPFQAELTKAEAEVRRADARLNHANTQLDQAKKLAAASRITSGDFERTSGDRDDAAAALEVARAGREIARLHLDSTRITAPISGQIGRPLLTAGSFVAAGTTLLTTLVATDTIHAGFDIDERTFLRLQREAREGKTKLMGATILLRLSDEDGFPHRGTVDFVANQVDPSTGTVHVRALISDADHHFLPGLFVRIRLAVSEPRRALLVPDTAVGHDQGTAFVYVTTAGNVLERRQVQLGWFDDGWCVLKDGLKATDWVSVSAFGALRPGMAVQPERVSRQDPVNRQLGGKQEK